MSNQLVSVQRDKLAACMRCGICEKLLRNATTISECMHHFCRRCIYKKITVEEASSCPVCEVSLGCDPLEKLRPDHNLRELTNKIFRSKSVEDEELPPIITVPLSTSPVKRKERSLSSLGAGTMRLKAVSNMTGKRAKPFARRTDYLQASSYLQKTIKKKENGVRSVQSRSRSFEALHKLSEENSHDDISNSDEIDKNGKPPEIVVWNPLTCLVEVANKTTSVNGDTQYRPEDEAPVRKSRIKDYCHSTNIVDTIQFANPKRSRKVQFKKAPEVPANVIPPRVVLDALSTIDRRSCPIWLQLVAAENQRSDAPPLPQISSSYLRIKDRSTSVSHIRKYLMKKLSIENEEEIKITCMNQQLTPTAQLNEVVSSWLEAAGTPPQKVTVTVGSSAKDFIMAPTYSRKARTLPPPPSTLLQL